MNKTRQLILIALAAAAMTGCGPSQDEPAQQTDSTAADTAAVEKSTADREQLAKVRQEIPNIDDIRGKPGAPVDIRYALLGTPKVGEPLEIQIDIIPRSEASQVDISINAVGALDVGASDRGWSLQSPEPGKSERRVITTTPQAEGLYYVNVEAMMELDGSRQSRVYSIPVLVGDKMIRAQTDKAELTMDEDGNPVIIMRTDDGT